MPTWLIVLVLAVLVAPIAWRWYARRFTYVTMLHLPMPVPTYAASPDDDVQASIRDALAIPAAELVELGFERVGYLLSSELMPDHPRVQAVLRHPTEHVFALVGFSLSTAMGATVDFVTLFEDGFWLLTVNRRAHFLRPDLQTGRIADALVASLPEQWRFHRQGVAAESARVPRRGEMDDVVWFREAFDAEEFRVGVQAGDMLATDDPRQFRMSPQGARALAARLQGAAPRLAACPPLAGVFAMRIPSGEQERKFQTSLMLIARRPKARGARAFLLSALAFAASMALLTSWAWVLWVIPVVLFHELGHWVAMRAFGHRDATIRFIPFFGAATMTTKQFSKLSHEMVVLLAGPMPGIILGLALVQLSMAGGPRYALFTGIALLSLNVVNLLPLHPLDGGRIVHALVTAGRPWFALALRVAAGVIFAIGAVVLKEPTLGLLAIVGLVFFRSGLRVVQLEAEIRRRPGFAAAATAEARRALIFDVLSERGVAEGPQWLMLVRQLEVAIGHAKPTLTQALPWAAVYLGCLGGIVGYGAALFMSAQSFTRSLTQCPRPAQATAVTCAGGVELAGIDWTRLPSDAIKRSPFGRAPIKSEFAHAAFIWCTPPPDRDIKYSGLEQARALRRYCAAFPWEPLPDAGSEVRRRARWTLRTLQWLEDMSAMRDEEPDALAERAQEADPRKSELFDAETERLFNAHDDRALSERIGRSPNESCKRLEIASLHDDFDEQSKTLKSIQIGVAMTSPADLAPLTRYLCEAGCSKLDVLPFAPTDPRLSFCFAGFGERPPAD